MNFDDLQRLQRGVHRMTIDDFSQVLADSIGASRDYARSCWARFQDNPLGYMSSRQPERQGEVLMQAAWVKGGES